MKRFEVSWALLRAASLVMILFPDSAAAKATADVVQAPAQSDFSTYLGRVAVELDFSVLPRFAYPDVYRNMSTRMEIPGFGVGAPYSRTNNADLMPLDYVNSRDENTKFDLNIQTTVSRKPDSTSYFSFIVPPLVACVDKFADTRLDMKQRKADDYAQRRQHAQQEHVKSYMPKVAAMFLNMLEG